MEPATIARGTRSGRDAPHQERNHPAAWCRGGRGVAMAFIARLLQCGMLIVAFFALALNAAAKDESGIGARRPPNAFNGPLYGPGDVYANIPEKDEFGRDQLAMFREWNPDPVGNHEANLEAINPSLARVVRKAQADNPELRFVIGSGKRDYGLQRKAFAWGWSKTQGGPHQSGDAVDLWPLDADGRVSFDPRTLSRVGAVMRKAAAELGVPIRWGGNFHSFRDRDRSHFELAPDPRHGLQRAERGHSVAVPPEAIAP